MPSDNHPLIEDEAQARDCWQDEAPGTWLAWVLAECEAKRRIIVEVTSSPMGRFPELSAWALRMLGVLALTYAGDLDYREEWRP